jgi:hypothetical protein
MNNLLSLSLSPVCSVATCSWFILSAVHSSVYVLSSQILLPQRNRAWAQLCAVFGNSMCVFVKLAWRLYLHRLVLAMSASLFVQSSSAAWPQNAHQNPFGWELCVQVAQSLLWLCDLGDLSAGQVMLLLVTCRALSTAPRRHSEANGTPWHYINSITFLFIYVETLTAQNSIT